MAEVRAPLTPGAAFTTNAFTAADDKGRVIEAAIRAESRLCKRIQNKRTGVEFHRDLGERGNWDVLYKHCKQRPYEFELFMEDESAVPVEERLVNLEDGRIYFQENELLEKNIQQLRDIAGKYGLTGRSKTDLVAGILKAQRA